MDKLCHIVTNLELRHTGVTPHGPVLSFRELECNEYHPLVVPLTVALEKVSMQ